MSETLVMFGGLFGFILLLLILVFVGVAINAWWTARQEARRIERETAFKRELLDRGLSVDEINRLLRATAEQPKMDDEDVDVVGEFVGLLSACQPNAIEEISAIFQAADLATRRAMLSAVTHMRDSSETGKITDEQIRAVVRGLARPAAPADSLAPPNDLPPLIGPASRITESLRFSDRPGV